MPSEDEEEEVSIEEFYYLMVKKLCSEFPALNPFEVYEMPAIKVFRMVGKILKFTPKPSEEEERQEQNVRRVNNKTATNNWARGFNNYSL